MAVVGAMASAVAVGAVDDFCRFTAGGYDALVVARDSAAEVSDTTASAGRQSPTRPPTSRGW